MSKRQLLWTIFTFFNANVPFFILDISSGWREKNIICHSISPFSCDCLSISSNCQRKGAFNCSITLEGSRCCKCPENCIHISSLWIICRMIMLIDYICKKSELIWGENNQGYCIWKCMIHTCLRWLILFFYEKYWALKNKVLNRFCL